jgi:hypothetical protein
VDDYQIFAVIASVIDGIRGGATRAAGKVVSSMNGVVVHAQRRLDFAANADAVIIGSDVKSRVFRHGEFGHADR